LCLFDEAVRSEKTNKRLPIDLETGIKHECASYNRAAPILVGGSGERKTLRIVAKYADACNLFGSVETLKIKLNILKEHCKSVGRNYDSILKTTLGAIIIDDNKEIAKKRVQQITKMPEEQIRDFVSPAIYRKPEDVSRQIKLLEEVGIQRRGLAATQTTGSYAELNFSEGVANYLSAPPFLKVQ
jgi:alkanesulfonate monooxygenase SsuD/methylene tetrahydromethanopterin reductase-like flavin-dependent oxidoreductase (luciferase family)